MQIQMPEKLTEKNVDGIVYVFDKMSLAAKHSFLTSLMMTHPEHYKNITNAIGENLKKVIPEAVAG